MKEYRSLFKEAKSDYQIYHSTYSSAVQEAKRLAEVQGYYIDSNTWFLEIASGTKKPSEDQYTRASVPLETIEKNDLEMAYTQVVEYLSKRKSFRMPSVEELVEFYESGSRLFRPTIYLCYDYKFGNAVDMSNGKEQRVPDDKTYSIKLIKETKKGLQIQVYNRGNNIPNNYELNCYIL